MAQEDVRLSGTFLDSAGNALANKTVTLFSEGTVTPALTTDTTDSAGEWDFTRTLSDLPGRYDVQLVTGTQTYRILSRDKFQVTELQARNPTTAQSALSAYSTTSEAASLVATFGFRPATESSGVETPDTPSDGDLGYIDFTLSNDHSDKQEWITARIAWEGTDVSDGTEDGQFNFWAMTAGTLVEELHLNGAALWPETDAGLDLGTSALGFNDLHLGSGGVINLDGGDVTLTHSSNTLTVAGGTFATAALTATTVDASTDFTIGDTVITDGVITDSSGLQIAAAVDLVANTLTTTGSLQVRTIDYSDGDLAMTIADGGGVTFAQAVDLGSNTLTTTGSLQVRTIDYSDGDNAITIADGGGTTFAAAVDLGSNTLTSTGSMQIRTIDYSDGDLAMTIADGGGVTFAQSLTVTGATVLNGDVTLGNHIDDVITINGSIAGANAVIFEGNTADAYESTLAVVDPTADHTIYMPNQGGYLGVFAAASTTQISSTPEELNLLDGVSGLVQADLTKLAAIDATAAEIDLLDGSAKSTSSITLADADAFIVIDGNTTKQIPASDLSAYVTAEGSMSSFQLEDDDGTEVTINNANEIKFIGSGITTNWTDTDNGTDGDPYDMTFTVDAAQTGITSLLATDIKIGEDDQTKIDFETADEIHFFAANVEQVYLADNIFGPQSDSDVDLGTTGVRWKDAFVDSITVTGEVDGASLDIEGDADINGTLETDNLTIGSAQGSDGQVLTSTGSGVGWEDAAGGGITLAAQWRVDQSTTSVTSIDPIVNFEVVDTDGYGGIGTAVTYSSGVFTFGATGIWLIEFGMETTQTGSDDLSFTAEIETCTDGSTFGAASRASGQLDNGNVSDTLYQSFMFDVTNTSTHKVQFALRDFGSSCTMEGDSHVNQTYATFTKLGDT